MIDVFWWLLTLGTVFWATGEWAAVWRDRPPVVFDPLCHQWRGKRAVRR